MSNFDDILKNGKKAATGDKPKDDWMQSITNIMYELHRLNEMYTDIKTHHLSIEQQRCSECSEATFILSVRDWDDRSKVLKFHKGNWKSTDVGTYSCDKCK